MPSNRLTIPAWYLTLLKGWSENLQFIPGEVQIYAGSDSGSGLDAHPVPQHLQGFPAESQSDAGGAGAGMTVLSGVSPVGHPGKILRLDSDAAVLDLSLIHI